MCLRRVNDTVDRRSGAPAAVQPLLFQLTVHKDAAARMSHELLRAAGSTVTVSTVTVHKDAAARMSHELLRAAAA